MVENSQPGLVSLFGFTVLTVLVLVACGGAPGGLESKDEPASSVGEVYLTLDFQIRLYQVEEGQDISFSNLFENQQPVVLNLWAGLCPPCRAEMPDFQVVFEELGDQVSIFGLDVGPSVGLGSQEDGRELVQELGITYPDVLSNYQVSGMPTTLFINPDGKIVRSWTGAITRDKLTQLIEELLMSS